MIPDKPTEWNVLRNLAGTDIKYLVLWLIHRINNWHSAQQGNYDIFSDWM